MYERTSSVFHPSIAARSLQNNQDMSQILGRASLDTNETHAILVQD